MCMENTKQPHRDSSSESLSFPQSKLFWTGIGLGVVLFLLGMFVFTGPASGIAGVWAISLFVGSILGYAAYRFWYNYGA